MAIISRKRSDTSPTGTNTSVSTTENSAKNLDGGWPQDFRIVTPLLNTLWMFGLFYRGRSGKQPAIGNNSVTNAWHSNAVSAAETPRNYRPATRCSFCRKGVYAMIILVFQWINFLRLLLSFWLSFEETSGTSSMTLRIIVTVWLFQCALYHSALWASCHNKLPSVISSLCPVSNSSLEDGNLCEQHIFIPKYCLKVTRRKIRAITIVSWTLVLFNVLVLAFSFFGPFEKARDLMSVMIDPFPNRLATRIVCILLYVFSTAAWLFPVSLVCTLCLILKTHFSCAAKCLQDQLAASPCDFPPNLESRRRHHLALANIVSETDYVFKFLLAIGYGTNIPLAIFILYELVNTGVEDVFFFAVCVFWLLAVISIILVMSFSAALVHSKVRA